MKKSKKKISGDIAIVILCLFAFVGFSSGFISKDSTDINIAFLALLFSIKGLFDKIQDVQDNTEILHIPSRGNDKNLKRDIEFEVNKIRIKGCSIDSIQIIEATGYDDHRKEVYIIYH